MSWTIDIPYRSRDDALADVVLARRVLPDPESRAVLTELVVEAVVAGDRTAGDLIDRLERTEPADRRRLLDRLRVAVGLETTADVEAHRRYEAANHPAVLSAKRRQRATLRMSAGGGFVEVNEDAIESERAADELREAAFAQRLEERWAEAEAIRRAEERYVKENIDDPIAFPPIAGFRQSQVRWS